MALTMPPKTPNIAINSTLSAFFTRNSCNWKEITIPKEISPNASYSYFAVEISDSS